MQEAERRRHFWKFFSGRSRQAVSSYITIPPSSHIHQSLPKLLNLRRKGTLDYSPLSRPGRLTSVNQYFVTDCASTDIRTLYILFLLSFLDSQTQVKTVFLEQHRDAFLGIFKGLPQDHYLLIRHVLEAIWTNLFSDQKIKRTVKVGLFNELTISHVSSSNKISQLSDM